MKNLLSYLYHIPVVRNNSLKAYLSSMDDAVRLILLNQGYMRDNSEWIHLTNDLKCYHGFHANKTIGTFHFSYKGNIVLCLTMWHGSCTNAEHITEGTKEDIQIRGSFPQSLTYDDQIKECCFNFQDNDEGIKYEFANERFDEKLTLQVVRKCLELLYKKAIVRNSKRKQIELEELGEINKQKKIKQDRYKNSLAEFINSYSETEVIK